MAKKKLYWRGKNSLGSGKNAIKAGELLKNLDDKRNPR